MANRLSTCSGQRIWRILCTGEWVMLWWKRKWRHLTSPRPKTKSRNAGGWLLVPETIKLKLNRQVQQRRQCPYPQAGPSELVAALAVPGEAHQGPLGRCPRRKRLRSMASNEGCRWTKSSTAFVWKIKRFLSSCGRVVRSRTQCFWTRYKTFTLYKLFSILRAWSCDMTLYNDGASTGELWQQFLLALCP